MCGMRAWVRYVACANSLCDTGGLLGLRAWETCASPAQVAAAASVHTERGLCRAWVREVLNQNALAYSVTALLADASATVRGATAVHYYERGATHARWPACARPASSSRTR